MGRCSPKIRQQIKDQLDEQNNRHAEQNTATPRQVTEPVNVPTPVVQNPVPKQTVQRKPSTVTPQNESVEVVDAAAVVANRLRRVPKRYWAVLLICIKSAFTCSLGQFLLLLSGVYVAVKWYLWRERKKDGQLLKALERQEQKQKWSQRLANGFIRKL